MSDKPDLQNVMRPPDLAVVQSVRLRVEVVCPVCLHWFDAPPSLTTRTLCAACREKLVTLESLYPK